MIAIVSSFDSKMAGYKFSRLQEINLTSSIALTQTGLEVFNKNEDSPKILPLSMISKVISCPSFEIK